MTENPYYRLLELIRSQQTTASGQFFTATLTHLSPPMFIAGETEVTPDWTVGELTFQDTDLGKSFLCLWLEGQVLLLHPLNTPDWREPNGII